MNKQELIKHIEDLPYTEGPIADTITINRNWILESIKQLDEPETGQTDEAPRYVKNILARLRELPLHDREVWLKAIMGEFEQDFSHAKWREGYEQGKFEGEWVGNQLKDADKVRRELNQVKIPQFIADKIEYCKKTDGYSLFHSMDYCYNFNDCAEWLGSNEDKFARAWLDGYEVEKEKRYLVKVKGVCGNHETLNCEKHSNEWLFSSSEENRTYKTKFTRKKIEEAGFGWVFDCPGIEIEEVE